MAIPLSHLDPSLERLAKKIEKSGKDYVLFAVNEAYALFMDRIFNDQGGRATNGSLLPQYSKQYKTKNKYGKRKKSTHWDLIATGDLMGNIKRNPKKDTATIEFSDQDEIDKAKDLEKRSGKTIFKFSKAEKKVVIEKVVKEMRKDITKIVKESFK